MSNATKSGLWDESGLKKGSGPASDAKTGPSKSGGAVGRKLSSKRSGTLTRVSRSTSAKSTSGSTAGRVRSERLYAKNEKMDATTRELTGTSGRNTVGVTPAARSSRAEHESGSSANGPGQDDKK